MTMAPRLLIATMNQGKLREFYALVPEGVELVTLADLGLNAPDETGDTFTENADLKALAAAQASGLIALADDSGLEVDALGGAPGVYSARYAGEPASDQRNVELLLANLRDGASRSAHFTCAISIASPAGVLARGEGRCQGEIAKTPRGSHGFGYDPVFLLPDGRSLAEYEPEEKNRISHRSQAIKSIAPALRSILEQLRTNHQ
jgi:XTP/dITP diphosphohydrolase